VEDRGEEEVFVRQKNVLFGHGAYVSNPPGRAAR